MFSGKVLNSRVPSAIVNLGGREEIWSQVASIQRLVGAKGDLNNGQQAKSFSGMPSAATKPRLAHATTSFGKQKMTTSRLQIRSTSTTPPAAASGIPPSAVSSTSTSSSSLPLSTTNIHSKRDASTQAKHLHEELAADEVFRSSDLVVLPCSPGELKPKPSIDQLLFGHIFTDHMFQVEWDQEKGWSTPLITKLHNLEVHPGAKGLHYAVTAFEGAKAYRGHDNKIRFFRLDQNIKRLLRSSRRLALPDFNEIELMKCIHRLVQLDEDWIPESSGFQHQLTSLYIRPTIIATDPTLGVAGSRSSLLYVLLSPVGPYFKTGFRPVSLYANPRYVRAWPGGAGNAKLGSNYAPTIRVQAEAEKLGHQQVLWLYGDDMKLTEVGTMNIFVSVKNRETGKIHLITPPLSDGLVLPGITRDSIINLARQWPDVVCEERYVTIGELRQLIHEERLVEMFGAGTACIVCPISKIEMSDGTKLRIPFTDITKNDQYGQLFLTKRILETITDIQYGRTPHPWAQEIIYS